jgi:excisionase family DNA binding protein
VKRSASHSRYYGIWSDAVSTTNSGLSGLFDDAPDLLTIAEVADRVRVTEATVKRWIHLAEDPLPALRSPGRYLVLRVDLVDWLSRRKNVPDLPPNAKE